MPATTTAPDPENARRGATIREFRRLHGLTSAELGRLVDRSDRSITSIERGERPADVAICRAIADALKIPVAAIVIENYADIADAPVDRATTAAAS